MFSIQNKSGKYISISDLGLVLAPKQCIDLDRVVDRHVSDGSSCLKKAVESSIVKILRKDVELKNIVIEKRDINSDEIKKELDSFKKDIISILTDNLKNNKTIVIHRDLEDSSKSNVSEETQADASILSRLHEKTMEKMLKNTDMNISNLSKEVNNSSLQNKLDELEGLL
jgi:hypothetical protein